MKPSHSVDWYFDFISPFAYLQWVELAQLPASVTVHYKPVLFAGLLKHWGQLGPAEIPAKRTFTYRHPCGWRANEKSISHLHHHTRLTHWALYAYLWQVVIEHILLMASFELSG